MYTHALTVLWSLLLSPLAQLHLTTVLLGEGTTVSSMEVFFFLISPHYTFKYSSMAHIFGRLSRKI